MQRLWLCGRVPKWPCIWRPAEQRVFFSFFICLGKNSTIFYYFLEGSSGRRRLHGCNGFSWSFLPRARGNKGEERKTSRPGSSNYRTSTSEVCRSFWAWKRFRVEQTLTDELRSWCKENSATESWQVNTASWGYDGWSKVARTESTS